MKKFLFILFIIIIIGGITFIMYPTRVAVLGYHSLVDNDNTKNEMEMDVKKFDKEMKYLSDHHYKSLTLKEFECFMDNKCKIPKKSVVITFDDGYISNYELAFPLLKKYKLNAVVFLIEQYYYGSADVYFNKDLIEKTNKEYPNIEFASHTFNMHNQDAVNLSKKELEKDFIEQRKVSNTKYYAYPYGLYNNNMIDMLKKYDYTMAFTFGPGKKFRKARQSDNKYEIPRLSMTASMPMWKYKLRLILPI